jgi:hypothetical protein
MANHFDPEYIRQQQAAQQEAQERQRQERVPKQPRKRPDAARKAGMAGLAVRRFLGGEFLHRLDFRRNWPYYLMVFCMVIVLIYANLLVLSNQKKLELLDRERIELNDKYIQIMDRHDRLIVNESRREALMEVFRNRGFVDDSSLVYMLRVEGKEERR